MNSNLKLLGSFFVVGILLLVASFAYGGNSTYKNEGGVFSGVSEITIKTPYASAEDLSFSTNPAVDFTYKFKGDSVKIQPISMLSQGTKYSIDVYYEKDGQELVSSGGFVYKDPGKAGSLLDAGLVSGDGFDITPINRFSYQVMVYSGEVSEKEIEAKVHKLLKQYDIDPSSVEIKVEYSRAATGDGVKDPFSPL